jgi:hypothetical protein
MFPYPINTTTVPDISNHIGPLENIDPEVPNPERNELSS